MVELMYFLDILKYSIAGIVVFSVGWFMVRNYLQQVYNRQLLTIKKSSLEHTLPLKLQAYERMVLFLERINPSNMLLRFHMEGMSARELQSLLLADIRAEYQHNIAQQIYISNHAWAAVKKMRDETINMVNSAVLSLPQTASSVDLSRTILNHLAHLEVDNPYEVALSIVKRDIHQIL